MKLLNLGCGGQRPLDPIWTNVDQLRTFLAPGTPERTNLDAEPNYVEADIVHSLPFDDATFHGLLCQHVIEHLSCHQAVHVLSECRRVLKPGGLGVFSVPDAEYFLSVHDQDTPENAVTLFGEPISEPWHKSFFRYALLHSQHIQILTEPALRCLIIAAGFELKSIYRGIKGENVSQWQPLSAAFLSVMARIHPLINRRKFSAILYAVK